MRLSNIHSIFFIICLIISFSEIKAQRLQPYTATEYINSLSIGFDTDFFKNTPPLRGFNNTNNVLMNNIKSLGVNHLRLRSRADIFGYAGSNFDATSMKTYLDGLEVVVQACIKNGVFPIISWIHHDAEVRSNEADKANYINWWSKVAERMRNYTYELSFNLFTEIDDGTLRDLTLYNSWTRGAVNAIRSTGGYNSERIIIFGAPGKKSESLFGIDQSIYQGSPYFAAEWHLYASGPDKDGGQKNWAGLGSDSDKENVDSVMEIAVNFTSTTQVPTWIGAWMPYDNINGSQEQFEVEAFACYFASAAGKRGIPWAMNKLDNFYDSKRNVFVQTESIGRYDTTIVLDLQKIWQSARCYNTGSPLTMVKTDRSRKNKRASRKNYLRA